MANKMENINDVTMEKNYTVYMHICPNGKRYIGITGNKPNVRWQNGRGYIKNQYFWRAINKYGWDNFEHIIIEKNLTLDDANQMEIELIAKYRSNDKDYGYNIESGGNASGKVSDETKKKISDAHKGKITSNETRKKISDNHADMSGEKNSMYGKKHSNETRKKISDSKASKIVYCNGLIFKSIVECSNYYSIKRSTLTSWLDGKKTSCDFKLELRYATENDLNKCERYDASKHGDKANINFNINNGNFVHCDNLIFKSVQNCANYYGINKGTMNAWLKGKNTMRSEFKEMNLRYATENDLNKCERYDASKHGDNINVVYNDTRSKLVHCDGIIFNSITECANYYSMSVNNMNAWLTSKLKMNSIFQKLELRYATENDLNKCERYDASKHGDTNNKNNDTRSKNVHCDNLIFNSIKECANYYGINKGSMNAWLKGKRTMNSDFQKLNLRYATNEDLNTYPRYTLANN